MSNQLSKTILYTIRSKVRHSRSSIQNTTTRLLSDKSKEWIPPSRPLSGDKGQSHVYAKVEKPSATVIAEKDLDDGIAKPVQAAGVTTITNEGDLDDEIAKFIMEDKEAGETAQFIDLDDVDFEDFQKRFDNGEFGLNEDIVEEDLDMEKLMEEIQAMEADDEDDVEGDVDEDGDVGDAEGDDIFQRHFEATDFLESPEKDGEAIVPDWLMTRRAKLSNLTGTEMLTPSDARKRRTDSEITVIKHTLLSSDEIIACLVNLGGQNVKLIIPEEEVKSYLGWKGLIIATANSYTHIRVLADAIVHNLRKRGLAERDVVGAKYGSEGGEDPTMSSYARRKRRIGRGKKTDDGWMAVDCQNYIVHVQDDVTRRSLDLEGLWSPGSEQGNILRGLDPKDEDAVDDYVAANPVPEEYVESMKMSTDFWGADGRYRGGFARGRDDSNKSGRYTPTNNQKRKVRNRGRYNL